MDIKAKFFLVGQGLTYAFKIDSYHVLFIYKIRYAFLIISLEVFICRYSLYL